MSLFFYDEPIKESDRSILNNSVVNDSDSDNGSDDAYSYYNYPLISGYPYYYYYGYPPYYYGSYPYSLNSNPLPSSEDSIPTNQESESNQKTSTTPSTPSTDVPSQTKNDPKSETQTQTQTQTKTQTHIPKSSLKSSSKSSRAKNPFSHLFDKDVYKLVDFRPNNDLFEDENNYYIQLDLPGMTKEQIHMELSEDRILKISGKRQNKYKSSDKNNDLKISKMDCQYGKFSRAFNIHETADIDKIQAKIENGVLLVTIPKTEPQKTQRRTIQIQ